MDNGIGNCITFQAKVRSPIKGRDNIIRKIIPYIEEQTKDIQGVFGIHRPNPLNREYYQLEISLGKSYFPVNAEKLLSIPPENQTPEVLGKIAQKFANSCILLDAENKYKKAAIPFDRRIRAERAEMQRLNKQKVLAELHDLPSLTETYSRKIDLCKEKIAELVERLTQGPQKKFREVLDAVGDKGLDGGEYASSMKYNFDKLMDDAVNGKYYEI